MATCHGRTVRAANQRRRSGVPESHGTLRENAVWELGCERQKHALVTFDFFFWPAARIVVCRGIEPFASRVDAPIMAAWLVLAARAVKLPLSMTEMLMAFARRSGMIRV